MKKAFVLSVILLSAAASLTAKAGEKGDVTFEAGGDVVSSYIWRGQACAGFSVQPCATITWDKPSLSAGIWASAELFENHSFANMNEFDLFLEWNPTEKLMIGLTDYHFCNGNYWRDWDFSGRAVHNLEVNASYDFGPVALSWNTCLTGPDYNAKGNRCYSTYVEASAPFTLGGVSCTGTVGILPWEDGFMSGGMNKGFNVVNLSLKAEKEIGKLPLFGEIIFNPQTEGTYFVVGVSF